MKTVDITTWSKKTPEETAKSLIQEFRGIYDNSSDCGTDENAKIRVFASPARINIIGEHIDYNGGKVFPAAIDKYLFTAIRLRKDTKIVYNDLRFPGEYRFDVTDSFSYKKENGYCNYLNGIITLITQQGFKFDKGFDILFYSNIPDGGGISSSSALECGFGWALSETFGFNIDRITMAKIGQQTEHQFMNVKCGIMDQFAIIMGKKDNAILLNCATLDYEYVPLELGDYRFVIMNTNKKRQLTDSKYNERLAECMEGLRIIRQTMQNAGQKPIEALCELNEQTLATYGKDISDKVIQKRVRHAVTENMRVLESVIQLRQGNLEALGALMRGSHLSLRDDYEVTGIELDTLFEQARAAKGCIGARMTGAGFGGCAIALVHKDAVDDFTTEVGKSYEQKIGYKATFIPCSTGDGTYEIKL